MDLEADALKTATMYQFRIPMAAPEEAEAIHNVGNPYTLMWQMVVQPGTTWYYTLTVSNHDVDGNLQESNHSNEVELSCPL